MRPAYFREQWQLLQAGADTAAIESLSRRIASSFIDRYFYSNEYSEPYIQLLCEMATHFRDSDLNQIAARALFGIVIERLCDDFEELQTETYNRLISQVTTFLRQLPQGAALDEELARFGLQSGDALYQRIEGMRLGIDPVIPPALQPRKVIVLSRVTIGADVAITSVICQRVLQEYPDAEVIVIGNDKLRQLVAAQPRLRVRELDYTRRGGLLERFSVWLELLQAVRTEATGLEQNEYLLLDPDSRLTQLGVLPLVPDYNYRFFNSRGKQGYPVHATISQLTNLWLDRIFDRQESCFPRVWLEPELLQRATQLLALQESQAPRKVITLNLGIGGNARKRVDGDFEAALVLSLLRDPDNLVVMDLGFGAEERARSEQIVRAAQDAGYATQSAAFGAATLQAGTRLFGVECNVGEVAALIARSDEFIGYDSACQHIAAALGITTFTVFAGTNNARFIRRWHASGPALSEILYVDTISRDQPIDSTELLARLHDLRLH